MRWPSHHFWRYVCPFLSLWYLLFVLDLILLLLLGFSFLFMQGEGSDAGRAIGVVSLVVILTVMATIGAVIRVCLKRQ